MTNYLSLHYCVYDQEVSFKDFGTIEKEKNLPFSMAMLFAHTRDLISRDVFLKLVVLTVLYSCQAGLFIWIVWTFCDIEGIVTE